MRIATYTEIILDRKKESDMFEKLKADQKWELTGSDSYGNVSFAKVSEMVEIPCV